MDKPYISLNDFINSELNQFQKSAVTSSNAATLVIAGAGSGKTRVITSRIAFLILNNEVNPSSIVALTFTNKAAGEMKERIGKFLVGAKRLPFVGTFHSYCLLLLRQNAALLPFSNFSIMDTDDQTDLIRKIITKNALTKKISATQATYQLSTYKNNLLIRDMDDFVNPLIKEIYQEYEAEKNAAHSLDFDDLLFQVLQLFRKNETFRISFQKKIRHMLVDEYQDTSRVQHELLKLMALGKDGKFNLDSLCAVGDEDQSIYSWRGATVTNMLSFQHDFAPVKVVKIEQNYRSVQPILEVANGLIKNNRLRNPKNLWSDKSAKDRVAIGYCKSSDQEADTIARLIQARSKNIPLSKIAVLYRTHFSSRQIEEALIYYSIPYKIIGGLQFYERKEIKDLLGYLRLIANPFDRLSLMRVINCPSRGLGQKFEQDLTEEWNRNPMLGFKELLAIVKDDETATKKLAIEEFLAIFNELDAQNKPSKCLESIISRTDYYSYLRQNYDQREADSKIENVKEFINAAVLFEGKFSSNTKPSQIEYGEVLGEDFEEISPIEEDLSGASIENFLYEIALLQEKLKNNQNQEQVQLMTLHAAKGLEFDTVIISGLNENILPSFKSLNTSEELEEERRLFYVGITRAQEYLLILNASTRNTFGQIVDQIPSRFLSELPSNLCLKLDIKKMHPAEVSEFWHNWTNHGKLKSDGIVTFGSSSKSDKKSHSHNLEKTKTSQAEPNKSNAAWKTGTFVQHAKFGQGVIMKAERASEQDFYLTVAFKSGQKKLLSSYLKRL